MQVGLGWKGGSDWMWGGEKEGREREKKGGIMSSGVREPLI